MPTDGLGIDGLRDAARGASYVAELPTGDRIEGVVWHVGRHQLGLVVEDWSNALLVVVDCPRSGDAPHGGGALTLSTYSLAGAEFSALEARLRAWWEGRYPA